MPLHRVEYSTWAGMIVTQYGRLPGNDAGAAITGGPPRQSTAVDQLQRYYGTGDTASEPGDFKPGELRRVGCYDSGFDPGCLRLASSARVRAEAWSM